MYTYIHTYMYITYDMLAVGTGLERESYGFTVLSLSLSLSLSHSTTDRSAGDPVRLVGGSTSMEGRVEIFHDGVWGMWGCLVRFVVVYGVCMSRSLAASINHFYIAQEGVCSVLYMIYRAIQLKAWS